MTAPEPARALPAHEALHHQVATLLRRLADDLGAGARLPSEQELMARFGVSRTTMRRAASQLVNEGILERSQGRGTFVRQRTVTHALDRLSPFFSVLESAGRPPQTEMLDFGWEDVDSLPLVPEGGRFLGYRRLYLTDERPHALLHVRIFEEFAGGLTSETFAGRAVLDVLQEERGIALEQGEYRLTCTGATGETAQALALPEGTAVLELHRLTRAPDGRRVETTTHYLDPAVYSFSVEVGADRRRPGLHLATELSPTRSEGA